MSTVHGLCCILLYTATGEYIDVNISVKGIPDAAVRAVIDQVLLLILFA